MPLWSVVEKPTGEEPGDEEECEACYADRLCEDLDRCPDRLIALAEKVISCECVDGATVWTFADGSRKIMGPTVECYEDLVSGDAVTLTTANAVVGTVVAQSVISGVNVGLHCPAITLTGKGAHRTLEGVESGLLGVQFQASLDGGANWTPLLQGGTQQVAGADAATAGESPLHACKTIKDLAPGIYDVTWRIVVTREPTDPGDVEVTFARQDFTVEVPAMSCKTVAPGEELPTLSAQTWSP